MAAFIGGVAAQEAIKACTNKFTPIKQYLYFDAIECLPTNIWELGESEFATPKDAHLLRYQGQIATLGNSIQVGLFGCVGLQTLVCLVC